MQVGRKLFTYPVLNKYGDLSSYSNKEFELMFEVEETDNEYILKDLHYLCTSDYLNNKIANGQVTVKCVIECSFSIYREAFDLPYGKCVDVVLKKNNLVDTTDISLIAYTNNETIFESSEDFDEDYQNIDFSLDKYQIVAADDGVTTHIYHEDESDNLAKSIFTVICNEDSDEKEYEIDIKSNKIEITMPKDMYEHYSCVYAADFLADEFFCVLLVPALIVGLTKCREDDSLEDIDDIETKYNWFRSVTFAYKNLYGKALEYDEFKSLSIPVLAQKLLGSPATSALTIIENSQKPRGDSEDE